jgi:hypothetical protein
VTPERMAELVARWVRFYTRGLSAPIAHRRAGEIKADVHDHIAHERARETNDWRIALSILSRMIRGMAADVSWRGQYTRAITDHPSSEEAMMKRKTGFRSAVRVAVATAIILLVPFVAMRFTDEVVWTPRDFITAGALLFGSGLTYDLVSRKGGTIAYRAAVGVAVAAALLLVWLSLAVGVIGVEGDSADLMYIGVLAVGIIGAVVARVRPHGMARALFATALAQASVAVIAVIGGLGSPESGPMQVAGVNGMFVALWLASAWLFRRAARDQAPVGAVPEVT